MDGALTTTGSDNGRTKAVRGRKDAEKQEATIRLDALGDGVIDELVSLQAKARDAAAKYGDAIKAKAEASGLLSSVLRTYIAARASENFDDRKRKVQQLSIVFEELGETA